MKKSFILVLCVVSIAVWVVCGGVAAAQDYLYIRNSSISDMPKIIENPNGSLGEIDFMNNPALLRLDSSFMFLSDSYYLGSYSDVSTEDTMYGNGQSYPVGTVVGTSELDGTYCTNNWSTDVGFALKVGSNMNLAFVFNYLYGDTRGDSDIYTFTLYQFPGGDYCYFWGDGEDTHRSHTYASTALFSYVPNDSFSIGAGITYAYTNNKQTDGLKGLSLYVQPGIGSTVDYLSHEEILTLRYHNISPFIGVSYAPFSALDLELSVAFDNYFGSVSKESEIGDSFSVYSEDVDSNDLDGWGVRGDLTMNVGVSDAVSIPIAFSASYDKFGWNADGAGYSQSFSVTSYWYIFRGQGPIVYDNDFKGWDISAGAGIRYAADEFAFSFMPMYTHREFINDYSILNNVKSGSPGDYYFEQSDKEVVDVLSFDIRVEKTFSEVFSGEFGIRYDYGWAKRDYDIYVDSPFIFLPNNYLDATNSGKDQFHDLMLTTKMSFAPIENLSIALSGMVTIPLDSLDYDLSGTAVGMDPAAAANVFGTIGIDRDYKDSTWIYGGMLELTYKF